MKPNKLLTSIGVLLLASILHSSSCRKGGECEEPYDVRNSYMLLTFKNSSGNYLYREPNPIYNKDSLKIYDEVGNKISLYFIEKSIPGIYWIVDMGPLYNSQTDMEAWDREICKKFIIKYYYNEVDTITTCYKITETKCGSHFNPLKVYHKGILLAEENHAVIATSVTITKN